MSVGQEGEKRESRSVEADQEAGTQHFSSPAAGMSNACLW